MTKNTIKCEKKGPLAIFELCSDGSTGVRGGGVITGLRKVSDGVKNIVFLVKFVAQEVYLLECLKQKLFSGTK